MLLAHSLAAIHAAQLKMWAYGNAHITLSYYPISLIEKQDEVANQRKQYLSIGAH